MNKDLTLIELFDLYGGLLTKRQQEIFSSYYLLDLSLSEIASPDNMTRQGVYEQLKTVKEKLYEYESVLKLKEKCQKIKTLAEENFGESFAHKVDEILKG